MGRITAGMLDSNDLDPIWVNTIENAIGEAARQRPTDILINHRMRLRSLLQSIENVIKSRQEVVSTTRTLLFVPPVGLINFPLYIGVEYQR